VRIAFVTQPGHKVLPAAGSLELWAAEVGRRLAERHDVTILASGKADETTVVDGITYQLIRHDKDALVGRVVRPVHKLLPRDRAFFSSPLCPIVYWTRVGRSLRALRPDVVHVMNYSQAVPTLRRFAPGARLVLHMHCEWLNQLSRAMVARRLRSADLIVGCSDHITSKVVDRFPEHAARCRTVPNGVDVDTLAAAVRRRDGNRRPLRLLNVGRVSPEKGIHVLVDAFNELATDHSELELTIVGDYAVVPLEMAVAVADDPLVRALARFYPGDYTARVRERLTEEAARRVTFVGRVEHTETLAFYEEADIFVFPSIFESFAIPPVEAMAAGLPVVASRVGGMKETIVHGRTGLLVEREDPAELVRALRTLIDDPELRQSFGEAGRRRAAELYSWSRVVEEVETTFAELVRGRSDSSRLSSESLAAGG
jgi:glycosyltransferase involved in cell wall biosynthesis